jgi:hypothetical protein
MSHCSTKAASAFNSFNIKAPDYYLMPRWDNQTGQARWGLSKVCHSFLAERFLRQYCGESQKLTQRVSQNMFDEMEKHKDAHHFLEKLRFMKQTPDLLKSFFKPFLV